LYYSSGLAANIFCVTCVLCFWINQVQVVSAPKPILEPILFGDNRARSIFWVEIIC